MEVAARPEARTRTEFATWALDTRALSTWVMVLAVTLYLAFTNGGYDIQSHAQVGIAVWWIVTVCAAWGLLPVVRLNRSAKALLAVFGGFTGWTALGITWSISSGRSFQDLALVACYLGILTLAVMIHRDRDTATRHTIAAAATAIVIVAVCALISRFWPYAFVGSDQTGSILSGSGARLSWPLNYWNALAALMAIGLPLLLSLVTSARWLFVQSLAAAAIPLIALCGALTLSRGGVIEGAVAVIVFITLCKDRLGKLTAAIGPATGSAILIAAAFSRHALQQGLINHTAAHQAHTLTFAIVLTCLGVGVLQAGVGMIGRHATAPGWLTPSVRTARVLLAAGVVVLLVVALVAHVPHHVSDAWSKFKNPVSGVPGSTTDHFSAISGEGRYQFWVAGIHSASSHPLTGSGPGTFQLDWLPRAKIPVYVTNAHSLYIETYAELGIVGVGLMIVFLLGACGVLVRQAVRGAHEIRTRSAGMTAALVAFMVGAAFDWVWQMAVIPAVIMMVIGSSLARDAAGSSISDDSPAADARTVLPTVTTKVVAVIAGLICLVALAYPLTTTNAIARSQNASRNGDLPIALADARDAVGLESGSAAAQLQLALVLEQLKSYSAAVAAARHAVGDEPQGWQNWLILSRLYAENGQAKQSVYAYEQAKKMNPMSEVFSP